MVVNDFMQVRKKIRISCICIIYNFQKKKDQGGPGLRMNPNQQQEQKSPLEQFVRKKTASMFF